MVFYWEVKFYPPAPEQLNEDLTRYLVVLQIRQDLFSGALPASFQTLALLGSYTAQGEIGDFDKTVHFDIDYLRPYSFAPKQSDELLMKIHDLHKTRKGLTPAEADLYFLENAKKMALYGMDLYPVKDSSSREVHIGVCASGIHVYHGKLRMESFKWPRILKISYKTNVFHLKVRPGEFEKHQRTHGFKLPSVKLAKRLWRIAVENHQFFRLKQPELTDTGSLRGFGNKRWRFSGRTQSQLRNVGSPRKAFSRSNSIMSSDTCPGLNQSTSTMPVPALRRDKDADSNKNYHTYSHLEPAKPTCDGEFGVDDNSLKGREPRGMERYNESYDSGEYTPSPAGVLDDSTISKDDNPDYTYRSPSTNRRLVPASDNLVNGEHPTAATDDDILPTHVNSIAKSPNTRAPQPTERRSAKSPMATSPSSEKLTNGLSSPNSAGGRLGSPENARSTMGSQQAHPATELCGVGELPLPCFSLESSAVMPSGALDDSVKLNVSERAEKIIKVGVPPTVKTTTLKFGGPVEPSTRSTRSPPTVKTEKKHFNYNPDVNGYPSRRERISQTTTFTTERDGYVEKRVKHTITISGDDAISDQLLLDAIQTVTGLDKTLGVDRIEIKTEEECS